MRNDPFCILVNFLQPCALPPSSCLCVMCTGDHRRFIVSLFLSILSCFWCVSPSLLNENATDRLLKMLACEIKAVKLQQRSFMRFLLSSTQTFAGAHCSTRLHDNVLRVTYSWGRGTRAEHRERRDFWGGHDIRRPVSLTHFRPEGKWMQE
jgi:hypothetical protein